ncbi:unnamed protein product [Dovyalis caffra]|uniref:Uncharacterized protein n=1 Tax=Dovyalis caffra TaxID=77055 RepID=A0AAV1R5S9_9ROSI|nr:unnamed protein product [Dovyalis caffra]
MSSTLFSWSPGSKEMRARRELNTGLPVLGALTSSHGRREERSRPASSCLMGKTSFIPVARSGYGLGEESKRLNSGIEWN